jgi:hypothetical protein
VARAAQCEHGFVVRGACASPITGNEGNREFFLHLTPAGSPLSDEALTALVARVIPT